MKKQDEKEMAIVIEKMNQDYKNLAKNIWAPWRFQT